MFVSELERIWKEICATWAPLKQHQQGVLHVPKWNQDVKNYYSSLECGSGTSFQEEICLLF